MYFATPNFKTWLRAWARKELVSRLKCLSLFSDAIDKVLNTTTTNRIAFQVSGKKGETHF